jgi:hypothetical protein
MKIEGLAARAALVLFFLYKFPTFWNRPASRGSKNLHNQQPTVPVHVP